MDDWLYTKELPVNFIAASGLVYREKKVLLLRSKRLADMLAFDGGSIFICL